MTEGQGPLGGAGRTQPGTSLWPQDFVPIPDRWRIDFPRWQRSAEDVDDSPYEEGSYLNPYRQNVLKGDYPLFGDEWFLLLQGTSDTLVEGRAFPIPSGVSTRRGESEEFFGQFDQLLFNQNWIMTAELFKGDAAFRPKDLAFKVTGVANLNYLNTYEKNIVEIDVREGDDRLDGHFGLQEALVDIHLLDLSPNYDFLTLIAGIQPFQSDFRGFMFKDDNLGVRLQGNYLSNRLQWNLAWFHQLEKDTNSGLNNFEERGQEVFIANLFVQDFLSELWDGFYGYTALLSWHWNLDDSRRRYDQNEFLVRPNRIGFPGDDDSRLRPKDVDVHYIGWGGEGHIGRLNIMHQYYLALGEESRNEITGSRQDVLAHLGALELSVDIDWVRLKGSALWATGDRNPDNGTAGGFDAIFENPFFAGAGFSYWNRQNIPLVQTGAQLVQRLGLLPNLRTSKIEGQANFVNPGLQLLGAGVSAKVTPKLFLDFNVNWMWFDHTNVLERVLVQDRIDTFIGTDFSIGAQYRPFLTENVILTAGVGVFEPGTGFKQIYTASTLYSGFFALTLTW